MPTGHPRSCFWARNHRSGDLRNISNMPTCSSSRWTTSGVGTVITISLPNLLRQRLHQSTATSARGEGRGVAALHSRASQWYENHGLELEAFQHAAAANDVGRAEHLIDEKGLHLHLRGVAAILDWLASLPTTVLDARPSLWVRHASALLVGGQTTGVEEKLKAAEAALAVALQGAEPDDKTRGSDWANCRPQSYVGAQ